VVPVVDGRTGAADRGQIAQKYEGEFQCDACAKEIAKALGKDYQATFERLRTTDGSDVIIQPATDAQISKNKMHVGVRIGDKIIDNVHPQGVQASEWTAMFEALTERPSSSRRNRQAISSVRSFC